MVRFQYTARDASAQMQHGDIDAVDIHAARSSLRAMGLHPETLVEQKQDLKKVETAEYYPFVDTIQLYAGWLLFGYVVAFLLGGYALTAPLSFDIPFVRTFLFSELILSFTLAAFLFLFGVHLQKRIQRGWMSAVLLFVLGVVVFVLYRLNT